VFFTVVYALLSLQKVLLSNAVFSQLHILLCVLLFSSIIEFTQLHIVSYVLACSSIIIILWKNPQYFYVAYFTILVTWGIEANKISVLRGMVTNSCSFLSPVFISHSNNTKC